MDVVNNWSDGAALALDVDGQVHQHDPLQTRDRFTAAFIGAPAAAARFVARLYFIASLTRKHAGVSSVGAAAPARCPALPSARYKSSSSLINPSRLRRRLAAEISDARHWHLFHILTVDGHFDRYIVVFTRFLLQIRLSVCCRLSAH